MGCCRGCTAVRVGFEEYSSPGMKECAGRSRLPAETLLNSRDPRLDPELGLTERGVSGGVVTEVAPTSAWGCMGAAAGAADAVNDSLIKLMKLLSPEMARLRLDSERSRTGWELMLGDASASVDSMAADDPSS